MANLISVATLLVTLPLCYLSQKIFKY